jgi:hypothetical protein
MRRCNVCLKSKHTNELCVTCGMCGECHWQNGGCKKSLAFFICGMCGECHWQNSDCKKALAFVKLIKNAV